MYSLQTKGLTREVFPISPSISDVELEKVEYVNEEGKEYLDFHYKRGSSQYLKDRRFPVQEQVDSRLIKPGETAADTKQRLKDELGRLLTFVASKFCSEEELATIQAVAFKDFCTQYADLVNSKCQGVKLYMKTVVNNKGYVSAPKAGRFLQLMADGPSTLAYNSKEEKLVENFNNRENAVDGVHEDSSI